MHWSKVALAFTYAVFAVGCTTVPVKEFGSYRGSVASTRAAAETVLADHGVALAEFNALKAGRATAAPKRPARFEAATAGDQALLNHVAVRLQAWEVVGKYNDALATLAEGRSAGEVAGAVDGLVGSLSQSPFADAKDFAASLAPFLGALKLLLAEADKEIAKQKFLAGLKAGLPLIKDDLLPLLRKDAESMADVRYGLNDLRYQAALDKVSDNRSAYELLSSSVAATAEIQKAREEINAALLTLPGYPAKGLLTPTTGAGTYTAVVKAALATQQAKAMESIAAATRINNELIAYQAMLGNYTNLIAKMASSIAQLQKAAETGQGFAPPSDELMKAVMALRHSYLVYSKAQ